MPSIMAGTDQKDSYVGRYVVVSSSGMCKAGNCSSRYVPFCCCQAQDAPHHGRYAPEGQLCCEIVVDIPFVPQKLIPMVRTIQQIKEMPQLLFVGGGRCPWCAGCANSQVLPWRRRSCSHSCSSSTGALCFSLQKTAENPQLQIIKVVDIPVVMQRLIPTALVNMAIPQLIVDKVVFAPFFCRSCRSSKSLSWRRGLFTWS